MPCRCAIQPGSLYEIQVFPAASCQMSAFKRQIDSDCLDGLHKWRAAAGVTKDDEFGWPQCQPRLLPRLQHDSIRATTCHFFRANLGC